MSDYYPDKYCILKLTNKETGETHYRVFATFYGGYIYGDSWKMNSGIESAKMLAGGCIEFLGTSGSTYGCNIHSYGVGGWHASVLRSIIEKQKDLVDIEVMEDRDWIEFFG